MMKFLIFLHTTVYYSLFAICCLLFFIPSILAQVNFRFSNSLEALYYLERKNLIPPFDENTTRLKLAQNLSQLLDEIFLEKIAIDKKIYSCVEILIEEFKDELKILKLGNEVSYYINSRQMLTRSLSGRFIFTTRNIISHPEEPNSVSISPAFIFAYKPDRSNFELNLGLRSAGNYFKVDEANVKWSYRNWGNIRFGRIYFLLGHLGLIGDNNFDAFEGAIIETVPNNILNFKGVFARLSSTNYPYERIFYDYDDYLATRISKEFFDNKLELGVNTLFSGIATEDGLSVDLYWKISRNRDFITEVAFYRPSKTSLMVLNPYDPRYAVVAGIDVINTKNTNIFLQIGDIQNGFTPMASSLLYSAQNHLYFDQNTRGFDIIFSYYPDRKTTTYQWQTRPQKTGIIPKDTIYELNIVALWNDRWQKSVYRYILRYITSVGNLRFHFENNLWDKEPTVSCSYKGIYNEARIFIVYEL